jgi:hypothetical protein
MMNDKEGLLAFRGRIGVAHFVAIQLDRSSTVTPSPPFGALPYFLSF